MAWIETGFVLALAPAAFAQDTLFQETHRGLPGDDVKGGAFGAADVDGDGWTDLLRVGNDGHAQFFVNRYGEFQGSSEALPGLGTLDLDEVAFGDLDDDGDGDAVVTEFGGPGHVLLWDGAPGFQAHPFTGGNDAGVPILGDVDGDGDLDAFRGGFSAFWMLLLNDGAGAFTDATGLLPTDEGLGAGAFGDVDGDGDLDLLAYNHLFLNTGAGYADASAGLPFGPGHPRLGDVDGDGDLDAVKSTWMTEILWLGNGAGAFTDAPGNMPDVGADHTSDLELGDVDGDGDLDVLVANAGSSCTQCSGQPDRLYRNDGAGAFTVAPFPAVQDETTSVVLADLDADGDLDAALAREGAPVFLHIQDRLLRNDGSGTFVDATDPLAMPEAPAIDVALIDADRDGDLDAYCVSHGDDEIWLNTGDALFSNAPSASYLTSLHPSLDTRAVVAADLDGDGYQDLAVGTKGKDHWLRNIGWSPAVLFEKHSLPEGFTQTEDIAAGDVDGDGDQDLMLANSSAQAQLLRYAGAWTFQDSTAASMPASTETSTAVSLVDVDQDGDLDGLLAGETARILTNDGGGVFSAAALSSDWSDALIGGDLDADGDTDLYLERSGPDQLLLGTGGGGFVDASAQLPADPMNGLVDALLLDVDADQDLDVLLAGNEPLVWGPFTFWVLGLSLLENDGSATFSNAGHRISEETDWASVSALASGDLDGDADPDVLVATDLSSFSVLGDFVSPQRALLLVNRTRQIVAPALPGLGKDVRFTVAGAPLQPWFLAYSTGTAEVSLPPYGTLLLNPASLHVLAFGALDLSGESELIASVPSHPGLLGSTLHWQALVGIPLRLSNRERTTFVGL
jgi:hypothetical protein